MNPVQNGQVQPLQLDELIRARISQNTGGRIRALEVELIEDRVVIRGVTTSYYLKQLALQAVLEAVGGPGTMHIDFLVQVSTHLATSGEETF